MPNSIVYETEKGIATITLNRPERLNAMNGALVADVLEALQEAETNGDVRVVVLTGAELEWAAAATNEDRGSPPQDRVGG